MKKLAVLFGSVMMSGLLAVPVMAVSEDEVIGTWYLNAFEQEGISVQMDPAAFGEEMSIEFLEGGKATMVMSGEEDPDGSWTLEGDTVLMTDSTDTTVEMTYEDGNLRAEEDGVIMIFGTEQEKAEVFAPGAVAEAPALEDFDGEWEAAMVDMWGMQMLPAFAEIQMKLTIEGGTCTMYYNDGLSEEEAEMEGTLEGDTLTLNKVSASTEEAEVAYYFDTNVLTLRLHENGYLSYSDKENDAFLETAEEAAEVEEAETEEEMDTTFAVFFEKK